ncbi:MAG: non-hydrolyzing UDP-N-acetylglucosamine 2-epimerase [Lachnospiraceae bacterium]
MKKIMLVLGTRPEAIKMCPIVNELKKRRIFDVCICTTGQHKNMLYQVLEVFDITVNYDLEIMKTGQTLFDITINILSDLQMILKIEKPDIVLVHGDTTTTFVASLACFYLGIKIGHVEAGLRTYNIKSPFPEEFNRQAVGSLADIHFAPTKNAANNLLKEGKSSKKIYITGNTAIDALKETVRETYTHELLDWAKDSRLILLTAHRRENLGKPLANIFCAIRNIVEEFSDVKVIYPIHKNPIIRELADTVLKGVERIKIIEPLSVVDFHNFLAVSYLVLTDSGGIQEEAPSLGKPVLILRDTTERPEGVEAGTLKLIGTKKEGIFRNLQLLLTDEEQYARMSKASNPYGDGFASKYIVDILEESL